MFQRLDRWAAEAALLLSRRPRRVGKLPDRPSIVVLRNNDLGDVLIVTPLFEALRRRFPDSKLVAAVGSWASALLRGNPHLDDVVELDAPWFNKYRSGWFLPGFRFAIGREARGLLSNEGAFDVGIDVLGSAWGALLFRRAAIGTSLGTSGFSGGERGFDVACPFDPGKHVGRQALRFADALRPGPPTECLPQVFLSAEELRDGERFWRSDRDGEGGLRILVAPGAGLREKSWPEERFRRLVEKLARGGFREIAVSVGPAEADLGRRVAGGVATLFAGSLGVRESLALVARCDLVVSNSSFLMHAAAAVRKPTIVLLGPSFPSATHHQAQWGYPGLTESLGKEPSGRGELATVDEVVDRVRGLAARLQEEAR